MAQAQKRIEDQGYTQVSALAKDDKSIWRGHAMKNGKTVDVALDYQGNVTANYRLLSPRGDRPVASLL